MADATTVAAWVGAVGTLLNGGAIIWVRRSETRPQDHLEMSPRAEVHERRHLGEAVPSRASIDLFVSGTGTFVIDRAGLQKRNLRRTRYTSTDASGHKPGMPMYWQLPITKLDESVSLTMPMADLYAQGVRDDGDYRAWVEAKGHGRITSAWGPISEAFRATCSTFNEETGQYDKVTLPEGPEFLRDSDEAP